MAEMQQNNVAFRLHALERDTERHDHEIRSVERTVDRVEINLVNLGTSMDDLKDSVNKLINKQELREAELQKERGSDRRQIMAAAAVLLAAIIGAAALLLDKV